MAVVRVVAALVALAVVVPTIVLGGYSASSRALFAAAAGWLLGPATIAFLLANLVDWPWHEAGAGAAWAVALGCVLAATRGGRTAAAAGRA